MVGAPGGVQDQVPVQPPAPTVVQHTHDVVGIPRLVFLGGVGSKELWKSRWTSLELCFARSADPKPKVQSPSTNVVPFCQRYSSYLERRADVRFPLAADSSEIPWRPSTPACGTSLRCSRAGPLDSWRARRPRCRTGPRSTSGTRCHSRTSPSMLAIEYYSISLLALGSIGLTLLACRFC